MTEMVPLTDVPLPVKLRVEDYLMLDEAGALQDYGKTELLDGEIVYINAQYRPHVRLKMALYNDIRARLEDLGSPLSVMVEGSIALGSRDVPEPDLTLTSEPDGAGLIPVASVALIVEVADTTLRSDLSRKARIYAAAGVPEYWVADVNGRTVHRMWMPAAETYSRRDSLAFGETLTAATIKGLWIDTAAL